MKLVNELAKTAKVVILIDEYDYPIVNNIDNSKAVKKNLKILKQLLYCY